MDYTYLGGRLGPVSRLGFGCDPLGGHAWGAVDRNEARRAVRLALDRGLNFFDTADCYGLGASEELLGEALGPRRGEAIIATKFGVRFDESGRTVFDNSLRWLDAALDASLRRLGTDYVDLYQLHYWDGRTPLDEVFSRLEDKRRDGRIRWYGITNIQMRGLEPRGGLDGLVSFSFEYSLANRRHERAILEMHRDLGLGFMSWGSLGQGMLTGKYAGVTALAEGDRRRRPTYANFHGEGLWRSLETVAAMRTCVGAHSGATLAQVAIRWILDHLGFGVALVGIKSRQQLDENLAAMAFRLPPKHVALLDAVSLERDEAEQRGHAGERA